jgi:acetylornithine deacetylase
MTRWTIDTEATTHYLAEMVAINSINPSLVPGAPGEMQMAEWLVKACSDLGLNVIIQYGTHGRPNVIATWLGKGGGRSILLTGHTDTVSIENMTIQPFDARIEDGRLYGRGAFDMKGGLASILGAIKALKDGGFEPQGRIILAFVCDEEYASAGTEKLISEIRVDAAILTEPSEMKLCIAHRGFAWLTITTHGRAAHGSLFDEGVDAVAQMGRVLGALEKMDSETLSKRSHPLLIRPSVHASLIEGGLGLSTYPDQCVLHIEHRLLPDERGENILALWQGALGKLRKDDTTFRADVHLDFERPGYEIGEDAPIVQTMWEAFTNMMGKPPEPGGMLAWLDSALLGAAGIPTVIFGPGGAGAHAAIEYVELADVHQCAAIIAEAVERWTSLPRESLQTQT